MGNIVDTFNTYDETNLTALSMCEALMSDMFLLGRCGDHWPMLSLRRGHCSTGTLNPRPLSAPGPSVTWPHARNLHTATGAGVSKYGVFRMLYLAFFRNLLNQSINNQGQ